MTLEIALNAANAVLPAASEGGEEGGNMLLPETSDLVWGTVAFVIIAVVLLRYALPRFTKVLDERTRRTEEGPEQQVRQATAEDTDRDGLLQGHVQRGLPLRFVHARLQTIVPTGQALIDALPGNNLLPDRVRGADPWRVPARNFFQPRGVGLKHPPGRGNPGKIGTGG